MSSAGQVVGGVVGAVVGFFASGYNPMGAVYGAQIDFLTGSVLAPQDEEKEATQAQDSQP